MQKYKLEKLKSNLVYPTPAYKVIVDGEEVGTAYKLPPMWRYKWKFEAANYEFNAFGKSLVDCVESYLKEREGE